MKRYLFIILTCLFLSTQLYASSVIQAPGIGGTGTANTIPKFTAATTVGNSQITDDGTVVGINNATPSFFLHARKNQNAATAVIIENQTSGALAQGLIGGRNNSGFDTYLGATSDAYTPAGVVLGDQGLIFSNATNGISFSAFNDNAATMYRFATGTTHAERFRISSSGNLTNNSTNGTAFVHLKAGTATASTAPLKLTAGTNLSTPEAGAIEFDGTSLTYTNSVPTRNTLTFGTTSSVTLASGTYTPVSTIVTNLDTVVQTVAQYMRVGSTVTVSGSFTADPTATGNCNFRLDLPIASNFASNFQAGGTATGISEDLNPIVIYADETNNEVRVNWTTTLTSNTTYFYHYTYQIL